MEGDGPGLADVPPQALEGGDEGSIGGIALGVRPFCASILAART